MQERTTTSSQRGNERQAIFRDDTDREKFLLTKRFKPFQPFNPPDQVRGPFQPNLKRSSRSTAPLSSSRAAAWQFQVQSSGLNRARSNRLTAGAPALKKIRVNLEGS
jgi:hypothetical protein